MVKQEFQVLELQEFLKLPFLSVNLKFSPLQFFLIFQMGLTALNPATKVKVLQAFLKKGLNEKS
jgi:hypothetical protein